ncbi:MAG: hypothetical protein FWD58_09300, partial [Firmicutes bacterium]|nr:hypothetical protein [Bacillota bacterium]
SWHDSQYTVIPENITLVSIPPYTPEMNPIEQLWREIRTKGLGAVFKAEMDDGAPVGKVHGILIHGMV